MVTESDAAAALELLLPLLPPPQAATVMVIAAAATSATPVRSAVVILKRFIRWLLRQGNSNGAVDVVVRPGRLRGRGRQQSDAGAARARHNSVQWQGIVMWTSPPSSTGRRD